MLAPSVETRLALDKTPVMTLQRELKDFPWPKPFASTAVPVWTGHGFRVGEVHHAFLNFGAEESHWSPDLTQLHEAEAGSTHPIDRASRKLAVRSLRHFVSTKVPIILDIGCSSGFLLEEIRNCLPQAALVGSDYIASPLVRLIERMPNLPILQFDLRKCPLPDNCVDAVTVLNVLEHVDRDEEALRQIYRILRPGGIAHIEVPAGPHLYDIYDEHLMHHRRYRLSNLMIMTERVGFEIVRATHLGFFVYPAFWIVKKRNRRRLMARENRRGAETVRTQIRSTRDSRIMEVLMKTEVLLFPIISFPIGIRCVLVGRKPL